MSPFQIAGTALAAVFAVLSLVALRRRRLGWAHGVAWLLLWIAAATAILRPQLTVVAARALGIDRGADLVFYLAILAMLGGFFFVLARLRRLDEQLTEIVRQIALRRADAGATGDPEPRSRS